MRRVREVDDTATLPQLPERRAALAEVQRVGLLYGLLNHLAPLARLAGIVTFCSGRHPEYRSLLLMVMAAVVAGLAKPALFKVGGILAAHSGDSQAEDDSSSSFHQLRLVWNQGLRFAIIALCSAAASTQLDLHASGLSSIRSGQAASELLEGCGVALLMGAMWSALQSVSPREKLSIEGGGDTLSSSTEDELFRVMPPALRFTSISLRCGCVAFETLADTLLVFVFLPSYLEGLDAPTARRGQQPMLSGLAAAFVYGSQHLRFRNEWLLCTGFGVGLMFLILLSDGSLLPTLTAALLFAVGRHARRTGVDVRRAHSQ